MNGNLAKKDATESVVAVIGEPTQAGGLAEKALEHEVSDIEMRALSMVVTNDAEYEQAAVFGSALKSKAADVIAFFKPMKESAHKAHKAICDREKEMTTPLSKAEKTLKKTMGDYAMEKERKRREQEEAMRRAAEAESRRMLEEAAQLESEGKKDDADAVLEDAEMMEEASQYGSIAVATPKAKGVSSRKDWKIVGIDTKQVPLSFNGMELRPVDEAAVMRLIRASKGQIQIPGITFREDMNVSFRKG